MDLIKKSGSSLSPKNNNPVIPGSNPESIQINTMFNFLKKIPKSTHSVIPSSDPESRILKLSGLHCPSCAIDIDLTLEDTPGVISAKTNYAKSELKVSFDATKTSYKQIKKTIKDLGYRIIPEQPPIST